MPADSLSRSSGRESSPLTARSCKECRRRKLKCDRKTPCSSCVSRGLEDLCPDGIVNTKTVQLRAEVDRLQQRILDLEDKLAGCSSKIEIDSSPTTADHPPFVGPTTNVLRRAGAASMHRSTTHDEQWVPALGTLMLDNSGRARYVGSTAASEWLNQLDSDASHMTETNRSDETAQHGLQDMANFPLRNVSSSNFSFLFSLLPARERMNILFDSYWCLYAFNYNVVSRNSLTCYLEHIYGMDPLESWNQDTHPHKLALIFIVLAMGSLVNPDSDPSTNEESKTLCEAAEVALSISNFMKDHTIASVQTLHIMANFHVYDDRLRGGDRAWPLGGLAMRITQAMGLHRDGLKWGLPADIVEERRRVFWEIHTEETFQAHCFGRPGGFSSRHFDAECPKDDDCSLPFSTIRYKLVGISSHVLDQVMVVDPPPYSSILEFHDQFVALEQTVPQLVRWTPASAPSDAADLPWSETSIPAKEALYLALKRHTLCLNINESVLFLLRTHFARALRESPHDPSKSRYHTAFQSVFTRCQTIIAIARSLYVLHPRIALRHWFFWYHACSAAVCMASIPIIAPFCSFALQAWHELQAACQLFSAAGNHSKSSIASLALLLRLRKSAFDKMSGGPTSTYQPLTENTKANEDGDRSAGDIDADESSHLMGLHTRLIERRHLDANPLNRHNDGARSPLARPDSEPVWAPSFSGNNAYEVERPVFSFDIQPESAIGPVNTSDFDLDQTSIDLLSSMRPDLGQLGPVPLDSNLNWNDLEFWLGSGLDGNLEPTTI
ncbi:uncharacterized protein IL334_002997 [Kwoniella shivajii]|uniref:Zn(2)-C6 fungal-type domain-containing protein n=1 Tax=Kwoniella shivajii TaxID=564305 RepID=A0ABZ1CWN0_9TREE|nr:hypothetical protein IL334_002997 [Kwoniella shivajii]